MGRPRRAAFFTLGCKVNQQETASLQELFRERGYEIVGFDSTAEVYIINTCTVTREADRKSRQMIRRAAGSGAVTAAVGCYAQTAPEEVLSLGVDVLVGTRDRGRIVDLVEQAFIEKQAPLSTVSPISGDGGFEVLPPSGYGPDGPVRAPGSRTRAFLKIEDGCEQFCSYCIVPFARGPVRSLRPELVRQQLESLLAAGCREVVLTGVHTSAYGRDLPDGVSLASLLRLLLQLPGEFRLRLSSVEPAEVTGELLEVLASPRICRHLHLPLQSGDDGILALMGRPYRAAEYRDLFQRVQERIPGVAVAADVMAGFPGETGPRFENTYRFIESLPFRDLHVFKYSPRPGTRAAEMPDQVAPGVKDERSARLRSLADRQAAAFAGRFVGETLPVLVERRARIDAGRYAGDCWEGLSDNYLRVVFPAPESSHGLQGSLVPVRALELIEGDTLYGET